MSKTEQDPVYRIIERAGELISKGWVQHVYATNELKKPVDWRKSDACAFCLEGAIFRASYELALDDVLVSNMPAWGVATDYIDTEITSLGLQTEPDCNGTRWPVQNGVKFNDLVAKTAGAVLAVIERAKERRAKELDDDDG